MNVNISRSLSGLYTFAIELTLQLPEFHDFTPKFGPVSGGTEIVISGRNLHAGSVQRIEIFVWPCTIKQRYV